jgi:hypothetical protein
MGGAVAFMGREVYTGLWWGNVRDGDHLKDLGLDEKIILKWIFKEWDGGMQWIDLAQIRDK